MRNPILLLVLLAACAERPADTAGAGDTAQAAGIEMQTPPATTTLLDPNSATRDELAQVPGMTGAAAEALMAGRPYEDMRAVDQALAGLSQAARDSVYGRVWKPLDLNSASAEEIELIPGVGPRMRHEFQEYRPYNSLAQFRREIGKYVASAEVARLEQYVTIR